MTALVEAIKKFRSQPHINDRLSVKDARLKFDFNLNQFIGQPNTVETRDHVFREIQNVIQRHSAATNIAFWPAEIEHTSHDAFNDGFSMINTPEVYAGHQNVPDFFVNGYDINQNPVTNQLEVSVNLGTVDRATRRLIANRRYTACTFDEWMRNEEEPDTTKEAVKAVVSNNLLIKIKSRSELLNRDPRENIALETLREMISESEYRKYVKDGFVLVRGVSGKIYQIFRNKAHTKVWYKGKVIEEVCVRISADVKVPTTDQVIAFMTMIATDEEEFRKHGNVYNMMKAA